MQPVGACVCDNCGIGFTCIDGLCCNSKYLSTFPKCSDGSKAAAACYQGRCGQGYTCSMGNLCCRTGNGINYGYYDPDGIPTPTTTIRPRTTYTIPFTTRYTTITPTQTGTSSTVTRTPTISTTTSTPRGVTTTTTPMTTTTTTPTTTTTTPTTTTTTTPTTTTTTTPTTTTTSTTTTTTTPTTTTTTPTTTTPTTTTTTTPTTTTTTPTTTTTTPTTTTTTTTPTTTTSTTTTSTTSTTSTTTTTTTTSTTTTTLNPACNGCTLGQVTLISNCNDLPSAHFSQNIVFAGGCSFMQFDCGTTANNVVSVTVKFNIGAGCTFQFKNPNPESPCNTSPCDVFTNINCVNGMWQDPSGMIVTSAYCSGTRKSGRK